MINPIILLGIVIIFAALSVLQTYLNAHLIKRVEGVSSRLERLEYILGETAESKQGIEWTRNGDPHSPSGVKPGSPPPQLDLATFTGVNLTFDDMVGVPVMLLFLSSRCSICVNLFNAITDYLDTAPLPLKIPATIIILSESMIEPDIDEAGTDGIRLYQAVSNDEIQQLFGIARTPCSIMLNAQGMVCDAAYVTSIADVFSSAERARNFVVQQTDSSLPAQSTATANRQTTGLSFKSKLRGMLTWILMVGVLLTVSFVIRPIRISGNSMQPSLPNSTWALVSPLAAAFTLPVPEEVVILRYPYLESLYLIKRVVATSGQCIAFRDGTVYINGRPLSETFVQFHAHYNKARQCLTSDQSYVLGDNRANSFDSATWGPLPLNNIAAILVLSLS